MPKSRPVMASALATSYASENHCNLAFCEITEIETVPAESEHISEAIDQRAKTI